MTELPEESCIFINPEYDELYLSVFKYYPISYIETQKPTDVLKNGEYSIFIWKFRYIRKVFEYRKGRDFLLGYFRELRTPGGRIAWRTRYPEKWLLNSQFIPDGKFQRVQDLSSELSVDDYLKFTQYSLLRDIYNNNLNLTYAIGGTVNQSSKQANPKIYIIELSMDKDLVLLTCDNGVNLNDPASCQGRKMTLMMPVSDRAVDFQMKTRWRSLVFTV